MLTLADRVAYQRAIEQVYWRHRIWPKERPDPKPSLDEAMPSAQLEKKVENYLRNSQALEDYWQYPLSAEQLQAEMERMAQHTKQPEVLRELFEALGNDPFVIAECLARPTLSERLVTNFYAHDQRFHGELRRRAEADLQTHPTMKQMKQTSGNYSEVELVRSDGVQDEENRVPEPGLKMNGREWDENMQKLAGMFGGAKNGTARHSGAPIMQIKTGVLSSLQEDQGRYYASAIVRQSKDRLRLATVEWRKEPLASWKTRAGTQMPKLMAATNGSYTLPAISDGASGCIDDTWANTSINTPTARELHTAVWTGSEMIVWGGNIGDNAGLNTGGRYNPSTDSWIATSTANAPAARYNHTAVWTGSEMVVWGGSFFDSNQHFLNTGGRYNPSSDSWIATSTTNAPTARESDTAVWTGSEMIVWGGVNGSFLNTGGRYNPRTDSWTATSTTNAPAARYFHTAVWSGSEMIVWGGDGGGSYLNTGGRYNPGTNSWIATSTTNAPTARDSHTAVWTGNEMILWGGSFFDSNRHFLNTGGRYNPSSDSWIATSTTNAPAARDSHTAVWTGSEMILWGGGSGGGDVLNTGGKYDSSTDSWTTTSTTNTPSGRGLHTAVWTGSEMIVWGGVNISVGDLNTGGRYDPNADSWTATSVSIAPSERDSQTAVWTGSEMIVWGGFDGNALNTGGRYNPGTDSWIATTTTNAPSARVLHTAVWTGTEMIVWGGFDFSVVNLNTGGRYNLGTDTWIATSTANAPTSRFDHTAVWSGSEMIVWGGGGGGNSFNTGGRYNPGADSWTATSLTNAPTARGLHTAVWTGTEMIVWGGTDGVSDINTGGRYNPNTDSWIATSTINAPTGRYAHTAIWTVTEMIVWAGFDGINDLNTGGGYNPRSDSWTATSTANVPTARSSHTAVWTGSEMIVWGGSDRSLLNYLNTGGRYNPGTDSWIATSTANAPVGRQTHTAVWSGSQMIVWAGNNSGDLNTGGRYCAVPTQLGNISTRGPVGIGDEVMIGGFIITGTGNKTVLLRAIGPSLSNPPFNLTNTLQDPTLSLFNSSQQRIGFNDNWADTANASSIPINLQPSNSLESAILISLAPGAYTAIVSGVNGGTGIGLVEVFDLDATASSKLSNISTRGLVETGDSVLIGGFIVKGPDSETVVIRAIGPSLANPPFNLTNVLQNPTLGLFNDQGTRIQFNDDWQTDQANDIIATGLQPTNPAESAIVGTLAPGNYTAIVTGVNGTTGIALVEVYGLN